MAKITIKNPMQKSKKRILDVVTSQQCIFKTTEKYMNI